MAQQPEAKPFQPTSCNLKELVSEDHKEIVLHLYHVLLSTEKGYERELGSQIADRKSAQAKFRSLKPKVDKMVAMTHQVQDLDAENQQLKSDLSIATGQLEALKIDLDTITKDRDALQQRLRRHCAAEEQMDNVVLSVAQMENAMSKLNLAVAAIKGNDQ